LGALRKAFGKHIGGVDKIEVRAAVFTGVGRQNFATKMMRKILGAKTNP